MESQQPVAAVEPFSFLGAQKQGQQVIDQAETLSIQNCYSCQGRHEKLPVNQFMAEHAPWTHWFTCPTTGDPVPLAITLANDRPAEIANRVVKDIVRAMQAGSWMIAIFRVEKARVHLDRHTFDFPRGDMENAIDTLRRDLDKESGLPKGEPLKRASLPARPDIFQFAQRQGAVVSDDGHQVIDMSKAVEARVGDKIDETLGGQVDP